MSWESGEMRIHWICNHWNSNNECFNLKNVHIVLNRIYFLLLRISKTLPWQKRQKVCDKTDSNVHQLTRTVWVDSSRWKSWRSEMALEKRENNVSFHRSAQRSRMQSVLKINHAKSWPIFPLVLHHGERSVAIHWWHDLQSDASSARGAMEWINRHGEWRKIQKRWLPNHVMLCGTLKKGSSFLPCYTLCTMHLRIRLFYWKKAKFGFSFVLAMRWTSKVG